MSDAPQPLIEALADRYRIGREVGRGGSATVYLADDLKHGRQVALKVLRSEFTEAELPRMRNDLIEINRTIAQLVGLEDAGLGEQTIVNAKVPDLDGALDLDRITAAVQAVQGLAGYASALAAVVDFDSDKDLSAAADKGA